MHWDRGSLSTRLKQFLHTLLFEYKYDTIERCNLKCLAARSVLSDHLERFANKTVYSSVLKTDIHLLFYFAYGSFRYLYYFVLVPTQVFRFLQTYFLPSSLLVVSYLTGSFITALGHTPFLFIFLAWNNRLKFPFCNMFLIKTTLYACSTFQISLQIVCSHRKLSSIHFLDRNNCTLSNLLMLASKQLDNLGNQYTSLNFKISKS